MSPVIALVGNPNVGKTTLFNGLTGQRLRTGNYPGVTVARHAGVWALPQGPAALVDLPGCYSLTPYSPDEALVTAFLKGDDGPRPDAVLAIVDASNPERNLYLLSQVMDLGLPVVVALNMVDVAEAKGLRVDPAALRAALGVPVLPLTARDGRGLEALGPAMRAALDDRRPAQGPGLPVDGPRAVEPSVIRDRYAWARRMLVDALRRSASAGSGWGERADALLTHKLWGTLALLLVMGAVFQSIYAWSQPLMEGMEGLVARLGGLLLAPLGPGLLKDLLADGVVAGAGAVLVFVPQIAMLFLFIALLEDCGYMARSAFLLDRLFARLGLSGRSFIPLLSSYACAVPGILATRTIPDRRERLAAMLVAPLMSCSARLPVYTVMIAAFIPSRRVLGLVDQRALVLLAFYLLGLAVALPVAWLLRGRLPGGAAPLFVLELPDYKWPQPRTVLRRVADQAGEFVAQAGTIILAVTVLVWALGAFPRPAALAEGLEAARAEVLAAGLEPGEQARRLAALERDVKAAQLAQSWLGRMGRAVEPAFAPLGWDWRISMAAIASFPAREVVIGVLGTLFSSEDPADAESAKLRETLRQAKRPDGRPLFNPAVALSLMVFFALCAQCAATLAVIRRESGHAGWAAFTFAYMTALAWAGGALAYQAAAVLGLAA